MTSPREAAGSSPDWEAFYAGYRSPDYVPGYEITSKLGGGMFGLVFRARKRSIGKDYAIKFLRVEDTEVRRAVLQELEQVNFFAQVDHPNLVAIEDRGEVDGIPYIVMAYAGSDTLRDELRRDDPEQDRLLDYFLQTCRGVAALHGRALVHFDLKPENVFLKGGVARVGDYGLSKLVAHSRQSLSMSRGTPYYMAPEMLQRRGDHRSDIYSLGVMLYEILTGEVPFQGDSEWEVLRKHEVAPPVYPARITAREKAVLERCLAKDPADRYASVEELLADLGAPASAGEAAVAETLAAVPAAPRPAGGPTASARRRTGAVSAYRTAVAVLLLCSMGMIALLGAFASHRIVRSHGGWVSAQERHARDVRRVRVPRARPATSLDARLREFGRQANRAVLRARSPRDPRAPRLRDLDLPRGYSHRSLRPYQDALERLARGGFSEGHARKLEAYGYPMFLAAVDYLQHLDYDDCDDLWRACNVHGFLEQATGFQSLEMSDPRRGITRSRRLGNRAAADGWRRFAEGFCASEADWLKTLRATGKLGD